MLVRDLGDRYQLVLQPDHAELSGQIAAAWIARPALSPLVREALVRAAARHDEGWAVWERHPRLDEQGRPQDFLSVPRESLLSSYQACVDVLEGEDPAAALLVSMHVSGLNRNRYGVMDPPEVTPLDDMSPPIREFVEREEQRQAALAAAVGFDDEERWRAYRQLQVYDVLSLYIGLADLDSGEPPDRRIDAGLALAPIGPFSVRCDPFPFAEDPTRFTMRRRILAKRAWPHERGFRADFAATPPEQVWIEITSAARARARRRP